MKKPLLAVMAVTAIMSAAQAQSLPPGVHVGMTVAELQAAAPDLERVKRPERMATGARGVWQQSAAGNDGLMFELTYFVKGPLVERIDMALTASPEVPDAAFERIVGTLRAMYGSELRSRQSAGNTVNETASWNTEDQDVAAYLVGPKDAPKIHVVYKHRELKDGSTL